ncbi:helix-turn-helix transcriptional regulator [Bacillus cereus]|nr:helix-turn-helix transcriptional regulator [Bacillus cereus]MDA2130454.1 helix-turn-helix transcriptional regulator [Bacillus cereus]MDA2152817.1 helix-turn-helix transcriptional regulator [Bacillus cereus]MDA2627161.1 helix-turn-helix transcriptional regulator [Bacillus cereus]MEB9160961.1 helix-turn-helix transcriptional regulator [Bacillus cereus]
MSLSKVKIARVEKGLTQQGLVDIVNVTRHNISIIESNIYNPSLNLCIHIAKTLDKSLDKLFWEEF